MKTFNRILYRRQHILFAARSGDITSNIDVDQLLVAQNLLLKDVLLDGVAEALGFAIFHMPGCALTVFLVELFHESPLLRRFRHSLDMCVQLGQSCLCVLRGVCLRR